MVANSLSASSGWTGLSRDKHHQSLFFFDAQPLLHSLTGGIRKFLVSGIYQLIGVFVGCVTEETNLLSISATPFAKQEMNPKADALENWQSVIQRFRLKTTGLPATG
jgi:hypothetical protein